MDSYPEDRYGRTPGRPLCDPIELAARLERGDPSAFQEFSQCAQGGVSVLLGRNLPLDKPQEEAQRVLQNAAQAIRRGELRQHEKLWEFLVAQVRAHIADWRTRNPAREPRPRTDGAEAQVKAMISVLRQLTAPQIEALRRFYSLNQNESEILQATGLTREEWRELKAASKRAFRDIVAETKRSNPGPRSPMLRQSA